MSCFMFPHRAVIKTPGVDHIQSNSTPRPAELLDSTSERESLGLDEWRLYWCSACCTPQC